MLCKMLLLCGAMTALVFSGTVTWDFDNIEAGKTPSNFKAERTAQESSPSVWKVATDTTAPSGENVLSLTDWGSTTVKEYSIFWTDSIKCADLEITLKCKNSGGANNNSGACWRVKDKDNYYCARASSDEGNFICYHVTKGVRHWLMAEYMKVPSHKWRTIKIVQKGDQMILSVDDVEKINIKDTNITGAGGVGVFTKGQGHISIDDFSVTSEEIIEKLEILAKIKRNKAIPSSAELFIYASTPLSKITGKIIQGEVNTDLTINTENIEGRVYHFPISNLKEGAFKININAQGKNGSATEVSKNSEGE